MRNGYTTGSCAAAAAKGSVYMMLCCQTLASVQIDTPAGVRLDLPLHDIEIKPGEAKCSVIKDGGDDPDITTGLKIFAHAKQNVEKGSIEVKGGNGVGIVTYEGLKTPVGSAAINPVPMRMILKEVREVLDFCGHDCGVEITIIVPGGEDVAKRTYNPKLGIVGGISILGTTGIVMPMSEAAWKDSLELELKVMAAKGVKDAVYVFGNYGESFSIKKLGVDKSRIIKIGNFLGFMLDKALENNFEHITLVGHVGKLIKVAGGIFQTHSRVADARMEILTCFAALSGATAENINAIYHCKTTDAAIKIMEDGIPDKIYPMITKAVCDKCEQYTFNKIKFSAVLFNETDNLLSSW